MKKITIYAIHSNKLNYKDEFYKPLLLSKVVETNNLILPLTDKYINMYAKDLIQNSDIVIINLTNGTFSVLVETNWAIKMNKKILFLIQENGKCNIMLNKYKKISKIYTNIDEEKELIDNFITENIDEISSVDKSGTITLGNLT